MSALNAHVLGAFMALAPAAAQDAPEPPPAPEPAGPTPAQVAAAWNAVPARPTLDRTVAAALRRTSAPAEPVRRAVRRARVAALLPAVDVTFDADADRGLRLDQEPGVGDELTTDAAATRAVRIRASWDLHRLVFDPDELRATRTLLDVLDHRAAVTERVTRLYLERRSLLMERALAKIAGIREDAATVMARTVALAGVEAELEAATGLSFSRQRPP